jgi:hypothetical protein
MAGSHDRLASAVANRLISGAGGGRSFGSRRAASAVSIDRLASAVATRLASHVNRLASALAARSASAVARRLASERSLRVLASSVAKRLAAPSDPARRGFSGSGASVDRLASAVAAKVASAVARRTGGEAEASTS